MPLFLREIKLLAVDRGEGEGEWFFELAQTLLVILQSAREWFLFT